MLISTILFFLVVIAASLFIVRYRKHSNKKTDRRSRETWAIGIYKGPSPLQLSPAADISNPILTAKDVTDIKARFVADPFMIQNKEGFHLFFEVLNDSSDLGEIGYAFSADSQHWQYRNIILKKRFHLSYPYVFFWDNRYYMLPECSDSGGIQLYEAKRFPDQWELAATILKGNGRFSALADPSIIHYKNRWYLFSYAIKSKNLHLFSSDALNDGWKEHPKSPIITASPQFARPAGKLVISDGTIYRYAQDETPHYGTRVWAFRITELTELMYNEEAVGDEPILQPGNELWNKDGMHTVDAHKSGSGEWMAFVDGFTIKADPLTV